MHVYISLLHDRLVSCLTQILFAFPVPAFMELVSRVAELEAEFRRFKQVSRQLPPSLLKVRVMLRCLPHRSLLVLSVLRVGSVVGSPLFLLLNYLCPFVTPPPLITR